MHINRISNNSIDGNTNFKAYMPPKFYYYAEKSSINTEFAGRKLVNNCSQLFYKSLMILNSAKASAAKKNPEIFSNSGKNIAKILLTASAFFSLAFSKNKNNKTTNLNIEAIKNLDINSPEYIGFDYNLSRMMAAGKEVEINIENGELNDIVNSNESCIFIMNHDKQKQDPKLLNFFKALLEREYIYQGKSKTCPRPKVILNKDILEAANEEKQILGEKWGAVGIDAAIHCANHMFNAKIFAKIIKDLCNDKINLFIFPEGRMCAFKSLAPEYKFQAGIGDIIKSVAHRKEQVKVVPLGFAYKKDVGSVHIGSPIYFKEKDGKMFFSGGTVDEKTQSKKFTEFMKNEPNEYHEITENGNSIPQKELKQYISGILCENLVSAKKSAAESIKNVGTSKDSDTIYSISEKFDE